MFARVKQKQCTCESKAHARGKAGGPVTHGHRKVGHLRVVRVAQAKGIRRGVGMGVRARGCVCARVYVFVEHSGGMFRAAVQRGAHGQTCNPCRGGRQRLRETRARGCAPALRCGGHTVHGRVPVRCEGGTAEVDTTHRRRDRPAKEHNARPFGETFCPAPALGRRTSGAAQPTEHRHLRPVAAHTHAHARTHTHTPRNVSMSTAARQDACQAGAWRPLGWQASWAACWHVRALKHARSGLPPLLLSRSLLLQPSRYPHSCHRTHTTPITRLPQCRRRLSDAPNTHTYAHSHTHMCRAGRW